MRYRACVEARLCWGDDVVRVARVPARARGVVRISDFALPFPGDGDAVVARGGRLLQDEVSAEGLVLRLRLVSDERVRGPLGDLRALKGVALGASLHATILSMAFLGRASAAEEERAAFTQLAALSAALDARASSAPIADDALVPSATERGAAPKSGPPAVAGAPVARSTSGVERRARGEGGRAKLRDERALAASFGILGLLATGSGGGADPFSSYEGPSARGNLFGATIEDAMGLGGATLSGDGEGGGGKGKGVDLDGFGGGHGFGCGCGGVDGWGRGVSGERGKGARREHVVRSPVLRCADDPVAVSGAGGCSGLQVNGRLPPEAVQRVVRQSFGRLRQCYELGLRRNPSLAGRVEVRFVIDREGGVATASARGDELRDGEVTACLGRAFQSMSFPPPEGGIVTVVYPLALSTG